MSPEDMKKLEQDSDNDHSGQEKDKKVLDDLLSGKGVGENDDEVKLEEKEK